MHSLFSDDLKKLNALYQRIQFSFIFLYGRYDTGKTRLVREFCAGKRALFFSAREAVSSQQLSAFWRDTVRSLQPAKTPAPFTDWKQAFAFLSDYSFTHRLVLVLDEFQSLMQHCDDFAEAFTAAVQHDFPAGKVFLIVTCSSPAYASHLMKEPAAAPFDCVTARASMGALPFYTCQEFLARYTPKEQLLLYGATGGLPSNLERLDCSCSARENILSLFFYSDSPLLFAPQTLLQRELREISTYNLLLEIISGGFTKLVDIAAQASMGTNKCAKYLNTLVSLGMIQKEFPAAGEVQKKVRYVFADHMARFWYRFVFPNLSAILFGEGEAIFDTYVLPSADEYLLPVFEQICADYLERLGNSEQAPFPYRHTGSWWCGGTKREPFFRIPLVAVDEKHSVLGACHCRQEPADTDCLEGLMRPLPLFEKKQRYYCVFSTSGFTAALREEAGSRNNVWLIDLEDIAPSESKNPGTHLLR